MLSNFHTWVYKSHFFPDYFSNFYHFFWSNSYSFILFLFIYPLIVFFLCLFIFLVFNFKRKFFYNISLWLQSSIVILSLIFLINIFLHENVVVDVLDINLVPSTNLFLRFGVDCFSVWFIVLTTFCTYFCLLHLFVMKKTDYEIFLLLFFLQWGIIVAFMSFDLLSFFIFFEATLLPIFILVLLFGSRDRKVRASLMISIYTLFGSVFMLAAILYIYVKYGTLDYFVLKTIDLSDFDTQIWWIFLFIAFSTKIPMLPFHIWLPEAHVEAPTVGSVLLAVLLLKLGTYGIIRFLLLPLGNTTVFFSPFINAFALLSVLYTSFTAIRQVDAKKIIAYSSVAHMNVVLLGLLSLNNENIEGAILQMLSHGLVSGSLFLIIGSLYLRYNQRSLEYFSGLVLVYPILVLFFLQGTLANISFPGTSNFIGEFLIMFGLFNQNIFVGIISCINMILAAAYSLWLFNRISFGNLRNLYFTLFYDLTRIEFYSLSFIFFLVILLGIRPDVVLSTFHIEMFYLKLWTSLKYML